MIVFDLVCAPAGHVFEAWFGSSGDYDDQRNRGLLSCPLCGASKINKAVMAPRLGATVEEASAPAALTNGAAAPLKAMLRAMAQAQTEALASSDYVGPRFAEEARAIHLGEVERRSIHGQATGEEVRALAEDGIAFAPLPFPVRPPGSDN